MQRIQTLVESNDGFYIAKKDLELRGSGDIFGVKQHGIPEFKIADLVNNFDILEFAQKCVSQMMDNIDERDIVKIQDRLYKKMNIS